MCALQCFKITVANYLAGPTDSDVRHKIQSPLPRAHVLLVAVGEATITCRGRAASRLQQLPAGGGSRSTRRMYGSAAPYIKWKRPLSHRLLSNMAPFSSPLLARAAGHTMPAIVEHNVAWVTPLASGLRVVRAVKGNVRVGSIGANANRAACLCGSVLVVSAMRGLQQTLGRPR